MVSLCYDVGKSRDNVGCVRFKAEESLDASWKGQSKYSSDLDVIEMIHGSIQISVWAPSSRHWLSIVLPIGFDPLLILVRNPRQRIAYSKLLLQFIPVYINPSLGNFNSSLRYNICDPVHQKGKYIRTSEVRSDCSTCEGRSNSFHFTVIIILRLCHGDSALGGSSNVHVVGPANELMSAHQICNFCTITVWVDLFFLWWR